MTQTTVPSQIANPQLNMIHHGHYRVDPVHTRVLFGISHFGLSTFFGEFTGASGTLQIDPAKLAETMLDISIPVDNIYTSSRILDEELKSVDWLDSRRYPTLRFQSRSTIPRDDGTLSVGGGLTLHGITKEIGLTVKFHGGGVNPVKDVYTIGFDVRGSACRSDFGVMRQLPAIGDDLQLIIGAAFELVSQGA